MTDRELLELAAKAAGIECWYLADLQYFGPKHRPIVWRPLSDDGDALRLAVKLNFQVGIGPNGVEVASLCEKHYHYDGIRDDANAATRRAITRAAAEIGKGMA